MALGMSSSPSFPIKLGNTVCVPFSGQCGKCWEANVLVLKGTRKRQGAWCAKCWEPFLEFLTDVELGPELAATVRTGLPAKRRATLEPLADSVMDRMKRKPVAPMSMGHQMEFCIAVPSWLRMGEVHREEFAVGGRTDGFIDAYHGTTLFALTSILRDGQLKNSAEDHRPAGVYVTPLLQLAKESSQTLKTPSVLLSKSLCLTQAGRRTFVFGINQTSATSSGFSTNPTLGFLLLFSSGVSEIERQADFVSMLADLARSPGLVWSTLYDEAKERTST